MTKVLALVKFDVAPASRRLSRGHSGPPSCAGFGFCARWGERLAHARRDISNFITTRVSAIRRSVRVLLLVWMSWAAFVFPLLADNPAPNIQLSITRVAPRQVEDTTQKAIVRDYGAAWSALTAALATNRAGALDSSFTGIAHDELAARVQDQAKTGLRTRITDRGHTLEAVVYTPEGSAMQLHDTAQVDIEIMDGGKVIHSEHATLHYVVLMTVAEDRWKVRLLQEVAGF